MNAWLPLLIMLVLGAGFGGFNILLGNLVGPKRPTPEKMAPYECGMPPVGDARERHPVKFYLVAVYLPALRQRDRISLSVGDGAARAALDRLHPADRLLPDPARGLRLRLAQGRLRLGARAVTAYG